MGPPIPPTSEEETEEETVADLPGFRPLPPPLDDLDPETTRVTTEEGTTGDVGDGGPSAGDGSTSTPRSRSSRASTPDLAALVGLQEIIEAGLNLVSMAVRWVRQRSYPVPLAPSTWVLNDDEREAIAAPLARIVERRSPAGDAPVDVVDGIAAGTATVGHGIRSLQEEAMAVDYLRAEGYMPSGDPEAQAEA